MSVSPQHTSTDTVYLRRNRRIGAVVFAVGWFFAAGGTVALLAWMKLWVLVGLAGIVVVAVEVVAVRAARIRLQFQPEGLLVANLFRTHRLARTAVGTVDVGPWASPLGQFSTLYIHATQPEPVRVEALAVQDGHEDELDQWLDRIDDWRFRRRG